MKTKKIEPTTTILTNNFYENACCCCVCVCVAIVKEIFYVIARSLRALNVDEGDKCGDQQRDHLPHPQPPLFFDGAAPNIATKCCSDGIFFSTHTHTYIYLCTYVRVSVCLYNHVIPKIKKNVKIK